MEFKRKMSQESMKKTYENYVLEIREISKNLFFKLSNEEINFENLAQNSEEPEAEKNLKVK